MPGSRIRQATLPPARIDQDPVKVLTGPRHEAKTLARADRLGQVSVAKMAELEHELTGVCENLSGRSLQP